MIVNVAVLTFLSTVVVAKVQRECVLRLSVNGSRGVHCDIVPYRVDLSRADGVTKLDMSGNTLNGTYIASDRNMTLPVLDLSRNNISSVCHVFASDTIRVDSIVLSHNKIKRFSTCVAARNLTLSWNHIKSLNKADMANASALETLDLGHNSILWIENDTFVDMTELQWLDLSDNALARITERTLPSATLRYLDVSGNGDLDRSTVFRPFENLVELNIAGNAALAPAVLGSGPRLQALDASRTNLTQVPVTPAPLLGTLVLCGNAITAVNSGDLDGFPLLRLLNMSSNIVGTVEDDAFGRLYMLTTLDLSDNLLVTVPKSLPESLETLNLEGNKIRDLTVDDFEDCKRLKTLNVRNNDIQHVQDGAFAALLYLDILDMSDNPIRMIAREMLAGPVGLKVLKLDRLMAFETPAFPFTDTRYLNRMQLAGSGHLAAILLNDTAVLSSMFQLEYLDLTGCAVTSFPDRLPYFMPKMRTLILDEIGCADAWLTDWSCEIGTSGERARRPTSWITATELRIGNGSRGTEIVDGVWCVRNNGTTWPIVVDSHRCAATTVSVSPRDVIATTASIATERAAVFARLQAKDHANNVRVTDETMAASPAGSTTAAFVCVAFLLVLLACGTVWLARLRWRQNPADVDYQSIEIKSLENLYHVERW